MPRTVHPLGKNYKVISASLTTSSLLIVKLASERRTLVGSTLGDVRVNSATQNHNTTHFRLYERSGPLSKGVRSESYRSVLFNVILDYWMHHTQITA